MVCVGVFSVLVRFGAFWCALVLCWCGVFDVFVDLLFRWVGTGAKVKVYTV